VDAELIFEEAVDIAALHRACADIVADDVYFRSIRLYRSDAPN
jgi:hypothetical protein